MAGNLHELFELVVSRRVEEKIEARFLEAVDVVGVRV